jgi:hypothetical protein
VSTTVNIESSDSWGDIYVDHHRGLRISHKIVRDDGQVQTEQADSYFEAPRGVDEAAVLDGIK